MVRAGGEKAAGEVELGGILRGEPGSEGGGDEEEREEDQAEGGEWLVSYAGFEGGWRHLGAYGQDEGCLGFAQAWRERLVGGA